MDPTAHPTDPAPSTAPAPDLVAAARGGDQDAFARLTSPHRRELHVHCYRMLGSAEDAEDAVQETFLRAWKGLATFAGRAPFRAWLYGIATHACLDALRRRRARTWPTDLADPIHPDQITGPSPRVDVPWLQPYPDRLLDAPAPHDDEPEAVVTAKETIELAFLAAIQRLPARQRAVLIMRDVLGWSAQETAEPLGMTRAAVNSALQRARASLSGHLPPDRTAWHVDSPGADDRALLKRLIAAWEASDPDALVGLLSADARLVMPPLLAWFAGRDAIEVFFHTHVFSQQDATWRLLPTAANRQPAFALYRRVAANEGPGATPFEVPFPTPSGAPSEPPFEAYAVGVLDVGEHDDITGLTFFLQPELVATFGLPTTL